MTKNFIQVLIVPGYTGSGPGHWQTLWEQKHPEYRRVVQRDWHHPDLEEWITVLDAAIQGSSSPVVLVAHSLGCILIAHWQLRHSGDVHGALLVAPADAERDDAPAPVRSFSPIPLQPLPFPSLVVASSNDPYVSLERAQYFAKNWGSRFISMGACGHIDTTAGFGPWRRGEVLLGNLMRGGISKDE